MSGAIFLPAAEVAEMLGIPASTLKFWEWSDTVPEGFPRSVKVGRRVMYPAAAVREWAAEQIAEAGARGA